MMVEQGHEVYLYSGEQNDAVCTEHIPLLSEAERAEWYGPWDPNGLFGNLDWDPAVISWVTMNSRAITEITERAEPRDMLCLTAGWSQGVIAEAHPELFAVEWAVGYEGIWLQHRVFESYAWMHHVYGLQNTKDGGAYDAVIPNFFDPDDFHIAPRRRWKPWQREKEDYLLFIGRLVQRKGPHVAAMIAERTGRKLIVAGPGATHVEEGLIVAPEIEIRGPVEYAGSVDAEQRADLMARAAAVIVPTQYIEPFGGVAIEAMMCGTPVVTTDWGAFTETVVPGVSGYRFHTLAEGAQAVERAVKLNPARVRKYALSRYSLAAVGPQFTEHFERLGTLWGEGWYA
jgi:glycosyltransferase involved in cell wall biosynthesis